MIGASNPSSRSRSYTRRYQRTVPSRPTLNRDHTVSGSSVRSRSARIGAAVVDLVGGTHPARILRRGGETREVVVLALFARQLDAFFVHLPVRHGQHGLEHVGAELVADALLEHVARVSVAHTILDHVVQDSGDDRLFVLVVPRQDHRHVCRMRQVGKSRPFPHLPVVVLRGKGESVVDAIGIAAGRHCVTRDG